ncbi:MAG TPA: hypothetical protein VGF56_13230 [Rhizomicrobium sp.]|jgi:hypothetical protein
MATDPTMEDDGFEDVPASFCDEIEDYIVARPIKAVVFAALTGMLLARILF